MARLVLYPQGLPLAPARAEQCAELVVHCGGDVGRVIDGPSHSVEAFARHLTRARVLQRREVPLVVLTMTNPVSLQLVQTRRTLEAAHPILEKAPWMVFLDPDEDPFFFESASQLGAFDDSDPDVPIWHGPDDRRFLVLPPHVDDGALVAQRLTDLEFGIEDYSSGVVEKRDPDAAGARPPEESIETLKPPKLG